MQNNLSSDRDILLSIFSDVYKDVHGFRPRGAAFPSHLSDDEIQAELDLLESSQQEDLPSDAFEDWRDEPWATHEDRECGFWLADDL